MGNQLSRQIQRAPPAASLVPNEKETASSVQGVRDNRTEHSEALSTLVPAQKNEDLPLTVEVHHAVLCEILKPHATKWREIGQHLGFLPGDLDNIQAAPLLLQTAPVSWMNVMLERFLVQGFKRHLDDAETESCKRGATMSVLETALNKARLGVTASQLRDNVQRLLAQGNVVTF